ncbi:DUF6282 family protein [Falsiroseomonas sp. HC035]|uniref:DUF6282 family protein n=1 Tax=Falsiroseomonas sp. HC035 TaxID=3390999 RepID=UPI003D310875
MTGFPPQAVDALLQGAVDLHHHGFPEFSFAHPTRHDDAAELMHARDAGMAGIVLKSHMFPTTGIAYRLAREVEGISAFPSITLNPSAGGFSPICLEAAARQGARVVYMPTWGAANDISRGGISRYLSQWIKSAAALTPDQGLTVTDAHGAVRGEVSECLAIAAEFGMLVATGHVSPKESLALVTEAKRLGVRDVMFQHPDSHSIGASRAEIRELAAAGAMVEFCALGFLPAFQRLSIPDCLEIIAEVGVDRVVLTTDCFFGWMPPAAELLRITLGSLLFHGMSEADAALVVRTNPRRMLGLDAWEG